MAQFENYRQLISERAPDVPAYEHPSVDGDRSAGDEARTTEGTSASEHASDAGGVVRLSSAAQSLNTSIPNFAGFISLLSCSAMEYHS